MRIQKHISWDDVLFENRNKAYGAYDLRKNENFNLLKSLFAGILFIGIAVAVLSFTNKENTETSVPLEKKVIVNVIPIKEKKIKEIPPADKPLKKPAVITDEKPDKDIIPDPKDSPEIETHVKDNTDLGTIVMPNGVEGDNDGSIKSGTGSTSGNGDGDSGNNIETPAETKAIFNAREVTYMAVFPGCEKFSNDKIRSQECFTKKLHDELGIQLDDFGEIANANNIQQAAAKLQFVVDKSGKIVQVQAMNGGNAQLSKEAKEAMERISKKFIQKGKLIQPAKLDDGTPVNLVFTIPVKFVPN